MNADNFFSLPFLFGECESIHSMLLFVYFALMLQYKCKIKKKNCASFNLKDPDRLEMHTLNNQF